MEQWVEFPSMFNTKKPISIDEEALLLDGLRLPARLTSAEVAVVLGFHEHDIAQLVVSKLLNPLGKPAQDREWLSAATRQISRYWQSRNEKKRASVPGGIDETTSS